MIQLLAGIVLILGGIFLIADKSANLLADPARVRVFAKDITLHDDNGTYEHESGQWLYLRPKSSMTIGRVEE